MRLPEESRYNRQVQELCQEQNSDLYSTYVDLTEAFDTVSRECLWRIRAKYGCPTKFITIVWQLHDGMQARVQDGGKSSCLQWSKAELVLAPTLFSLIFSEMLTDTYYDIMAWTLESASDGVLTAPSSTSGDC